MPAELGSEAMHQLSPLCSSCGPRPPMRLSVQTMCQGRRRGREAPLLQPLPLPLPLRELCPQRWCPFGAQKWSDRTVSSTLSPTEALVAQRLELIEGL